jgi:preprotein translocase subunit SecD
MIYFAKWKVWATLAVLLAGMLFAAPNLLTQEQADQLPRWVPHKRISLGLDLQGGSHLLFEVDMGAVVQDRLQSTRDAVREVLRRNDVGYTGLSVAPDRVVAQLVDPGARDRALSLLREAIVGLDVRIDDAGRIEIFYPEAELRTLQAQVLEHSIEIIRRRIDESGVKEPTIVRQGSDRIIVQLPGVSDPQRLKDLIGKTAKMTFQFVDSTVESPVTTKPANLPPGSVALPSRDGNFEIVESRVILTGENLVDARAGRHPTTNEPVVNFEFDSAGARRFARATTENVGRRFAIILDNEVISAPVIDEPIPGGRGFIRGRFTADTAHDLAVLLRAGALPAPMQVIEERTVGAELGADSIAAGQIACIIGIVLVLAAMIAFYGLFGIFANIALLFNFILLIGVMSALQATLTLPGIAGIVLTLGMAVDANVLIYERVREEIRAGRSPVTALDQGYRQAIGTIWDANLTTMIAAFFLYVFGTGPVRGFAVTLGLGLMISMFTAIVVARMLTVFWLRQTRPKALPI